MISRSTKRKLNKLAKRVGCTLNWKRSSRNDFKWNGKDMACKYASITNIIHDIAHYALADKKSRQSTDFGLGNSPPYYIVLESDVIYKQNKCDYIERQASVLGIYWEKELGFRWKDTAKYHGWFAYYDDYYDIININKE